MIFWIAAALLAAGSVALLLRPLVRPDMTAAGRGAYDLAVYRDQLSEIERDAGRGLITGDQAKAARAEIGRRMLSAADAAPAEPRPGRRTTRAAALALTVIVPVAALSLYLSAGSPGLPALPFAERVAAAREQALMIRGMVDRLAARMAETPDDLDGWLRLGRSYQVLGEPAQAAGALANAARLAPDDTAVLAAYADALLAASDGETLPPEFAATIERLYALDPDNVRALWYMGGKALAENRPDDAARLWRRVLAQLPPGSEEHRLVEERLNELEDGPPAEAETAD